MARFRQRFRPFTYGFSGKVQRQEEKVQNRGTWNSQKTDVFLIYFRITLEACNPRRCFRQYRVEAGTDLLGSWVVEISYGRIGTAGRSRCFGARSDLVISYSRCRVDAEAS